MRDKILASILAFARDRGGVLGLIFGLSLLPVMAFIGIAIDYGRATADRSGYQAAVDAGVLAGATLNLSDDQRLDRAQAAFQSMLSPVQRTNLTASSFTIDADKTTITGRASARTPTRFGAFTGVQPIAQSVTAASRIARPQVRQLDLVMCIDGTGSMTPTLNAVKQNALTLEANINAELQRRGLPAFDAMRVRPLVYRDFGGNSWFDPSAGGWAFTGTGFIWVSSSDPMRGQYVGDVPPIDASPFFSLPDQRVAFSSVLQPETAWGGGDEPESGLECVNEGMNSPFAHAGDHLANGQKLTAAFPVIVVWTDANAHPPAWPKSLQNPLYPPPEVMPRSHAGLLAKWNDATRIDPTNRLLVFFGGPSTFGTQMDPQGWPPVQAWPNYYYGGTLSDGNALMVKRIVDAISTKFAQPTITH